MTVQDDLATVRAQLAHLGPWRGAVGDAALARIEARLEQADRLAETVGEYAFGDGLWEDVTVAVDEWDGAK